MLSKTREWDLRCPRALMNMFPVRRGYYYKVDRKQARKIVRILARAYGVPVPTVCDTAPDKGYNGTYWYNGERIQVHARCHMKSVFHEFYHHLENKTNGKYDSNDRRGGASSYAWQFADHLFDLLRVQLMLDGK